MSWSRTQRITDIGAQAHMTVGAIFMGYWFKCVCVCVCVSELGSIAYICNRLQLQLL